MEETNGVIMQYFHWYSPADGTLWEEARSCARELAAAGFSAVWLPPAYKGVNGAADVGYGVYDMYDLGEFDQKGSVRTKYGTKDQYLAAIKSLQEAGLQVYADTVLNHRTGADGTEQVRATPYPQDDRLQAKGRRATSEPTRVFSSPAGKKYSPFEWHARHIDAVDYDEMNPAEKNTIYLLEGKQFDNYVALEMGNYSFLMGADLDFENAEVRDEVTAWGKWYLDTTGVDGFRLDAVKHISSWFFPQWLDAMERHAGRDLFVVAEYWSTELSALTWYLINSAEGSRCLRCLCITTSTPRVTPAATTTSPLVGRHAHAAARSRYCDLCREPRLTAAAVAGIGRGALVQAARVCPDSAAARRLSVRLLSGLLRRRVRGRGARRQSPPDCHAFTSSRD